MENNQRQYTTAGTDIEEVKRLNAESGLSYNEVKELLAKTTGGSGTRIYSDTKIEEVRAKNQHALEQSNIADKPNGF